MQRLRANYDSMSKSQQRVAEFFLTRGLETVYLPAARIAEIMDVSHSTVVRTAQAIGFDGFPDLQAALQEHFLGRLNSASVYQIGARKLVKELADQQEDTSAAAVLQRVMMTDSRNIENMLPQIPVRDFEQAVDWLVKAPRVFVMGLRSSSPLALYVGLGLRQIRPNTFVLQPGVGDLADQITMIQSGDVVFTLCFGRYMKDTLRCMEYAKKVGAQVITVTDTPLSPAAMRADISFIVRYGVWFYGASAALISLLNALIAAILLREGEKAQQRMEVIDGVIDHFGMFVPLKDDEMSDFDI